MHHKLGFALFITLTITSFQTIATPVSECNSQNPNNCLNGVGPAVTNPDNIRATASQVSGQMNRQTGGQEEDLAFIGNSAFKGLAAGEHFSGWGFWASYNFLDFDADIPINSAVQPVASYDADQNSVLIGADTFVLDKLVAGLALGYENTDLATNYNGGNSDTDGFLVAPYFAYLINNIFSIDLSAGYTVLDYETDRIDNVSGGTIVGEFDADRWFVTSNVNALINYEQWVFNGRAGILYTEEEQDGYTETGPNTARTILDRHLDLTQAIAGLDVAYNFDWFEPYVTMAYINDLGRDNGIGSGGLPAGVGRTQPDDDDEIRFGFGFRYFGNYITGMLEYMTVFDRDTFDSNNLMLTIRADL